MNAVSGAMSRFWKLWNSWLPAVFLLASLSFNVYFVSVTHRSRASQLVRSEIFAIGQKLPALTVQDLDGHKVTLNWTNDRRSVLLYIFRESCIWCARNMPNVRSLIRSPNLQYRLVGLSLSDEALRTYVQNNGLSFPVYTNAQFANGSAFSADGTPETLILSPSGIITQRWLGAYSGSMQRDIERVLGVTLPGLQNDSGRETSPMGNDEASVLNGDERF